MDPALMTDIPLKPPPPGVISNFDEPETLKFQGVLTMTFCVAVGAVAIVLRIYIKIFITHLYGWDDVWCILAYVGVTAKVVISISIMGTGKGRMLGVHIWDVRALDVTKTFLQKILTAVCLYAVAALFVKLSLFCLYLRLFRIKRSTRWLIYVGIATCFIVYTASVTANCVWLVPPPGQPQTLESWITHSEKVGKKPNQLALFQGIFGTLSDLYLLAIPVRSVLALKMPPAKKAGVCMIFMTGIIAVACSIVSLVFRIKVLNSTDNTWDNNMVFIFSAAEVTAGIVCASTPICAAIFTGGRGRFFSSYSFRLPWTRKSSGTQSGGTGQSSNGTSSTSRQRQKKKGLNTESADDLFTAPVNGRRDSSTRSIELQSVVVK